MPTEENDNHSPVDSLQNSAMESWRFFRLTYKLLMQRDLGERGRRQNKVRLYLRKPDKGIGIDTQRWAPQNLTAG